MYVLLLRHIYIYCHISLIKNVFFLALAKKTNFTFFFQMKHLMQIASCLLCIYIFDYYCKKEHFYQVTPSCFLPNPVAASIDKARDEIVSGILGQFKGNELEIVGKRKRWHNCHKRMCKNCNTHTAKDEICQYIFIQYTSALYLVCSFYLYNK